MADTLRIEGQVADGFEPVRAVFRQNFVKRGEIGASVCVYHQGRRVVDLWGGLRRQNPAETWQADTLCVVFSATKGLAALCLLMLADRGQLDYDQRVAHYWPGFAREGKDAITVRQLLNHRSGLSAVDIPLCIDDFSQRPEHVVDALEQQRPLWAPGSRQGYCAVSFGLYASELFRRIAGTSLGVFLAQEVNEALGADVYLGLPDALESRVATVYPMGWAEKLGQVFPKLLVSRGLEGRVYRQFVRAKSATRRAFANPADLGIKGIGNFNTARVRSLELPWSNACASARGLARVYGALAQGGTLEGVTLCQPETLTPVHARQSWGYDAVLRKPMGWSQGFIKEETRLFSPNEAAFGHPGAGGALGLADPEARLGIGYVMNRMGHHVRSPRALALCHAVYRCLEVSTSSRD